MNDFKNATSLSSRLQQVLDAVQEGSCFTLNALLEQADKESFGLILALLAIISALPLPVGCNSPFGLLILWLGFTWLKPHPSIQLPHWAKKKHLKKGLLLKGLQFGLKIFMILEGWSRPRARFMWTPPGKAFTGIALAGLGFLIALPIPLTNTAPSGVVGLIGLSIALKDGLWLCAATVLAWIALSLYALLAYGLWCYGWGLWEKILAYWSSISI
jgi:hypothetical protein